MCGIFGSTNFEKFKTLYSINQDRGAFSFGGCYVSSIGDVELMIEKAPGVVDLDDGVQTNHNYFTGHTQAPTSVQREFSHETTHPFTTGNWAVAHNGVLSNNRQIIAKYDFHNVNEVDSSVIPALIDHNEIIDRSNVVQQEIFAIREALEELDGTYACWIINKVTGNVYIARVGSTLFMNRDTGDFSSKKHRDLKTVPEGLIFKLNSDNMCFEIAGQFKYNSPYFIL